MLSALKNPLSQLHVLLEVKVAFDLQVVHVVAELLQVAQLSAHFEHLNGLEDER